MATARDPGHLVPAMRRGAGTALVLLAALGPLATAASPALASPQATTAPLAISVVVPLTAQPGEDGLLDAAALEAMTAPSGTLSRELDEVLATSATVALDPMLLTSIRVLGTEAPDSAVEWLARLESAPNEVFLLAYADADLSALARAASLDLAEPIGFDFALDPGAFGPPLTDTPSASPTPTPTGDGGDDDPPPRPTTEELLAWPDAIGRIAWPSAGSVIGADLPAYAAADYDAVLLSSANVSETSGARADLDGVAGLVADSAASDLFREASTSIDPATRGDVVERLGVALDGLAAAHPGRSVVLTLDRRTTFTFSALEEVYRAVEVRDSTRMTGLAEVLKGPSEAAAVVDGEAAPHIAEAPALAAALRSEASFASVLTDPRQLTAPRRLELLALLAVPEVAASDWADRARSFLIRSTEILGSVTIVDTGSVVVASSQTSIPIRIANALDFAVTVRVSAVPLRPLLRIDGPAEVTVEPGSSKTVGLDAQAITNGRVSVRAELSSPTGVSIGEPRTFQADLQAQWETVGIVVGVLAAVVFAGGIVRNIVGRRRKAARERPAGDEGS
jgi:hypothetical protein